MSWTALVAEYLVVGFQTLLWLTLFFLSAEEISMPLFLEWLGKLPTSTTALLVTSSVVFTYSLGLLLDKIWHEITEPLLEDRVQRLWLQFHNHKDTDVQQEQKKQIGDAFYNAEDKLYGKEGLQARIYRRRGRIRILRALLFNIPMIILAISLHYFSLLIISVGLIFEGLVLIAFLSVHEEYVHMIAREDRSDPIHTVFLRDALDTASTAKKKWWKFWK